MTRIHQKRRKRQYPRATTREQSLIAQRADLEGQLDTALGLIRTQRMRILALTTINAQVSQLAEQRRVDLVAMRVVV